MKNIILLFLISFLPLVSTSLSLQAQNMKSYSFKSISIEDGLSQSTVTSVWNAHDGSLWIGTRNGLNRYFQDNLKCYYNDKSANSLSDNSILFVMEDSCSTLWVATEEGLMKYDKKHDNFIPSFCEGKSFIAYSYCFVEGGILFGTRGELLKYDYSTSEFLKLPLGGQFADTSAFEYILKESAHECLLISRSGEFFRYDIHSLNITPLEYLKPYDYITAAYIDSFGKLWLSSYKKGLVRLDRNGRVELSLTHRNSKLSNEIILDIIERNGELWIATDGGGINVYSFDTGDIQVIREEPGNPYSLSHNSILTLYNDVNNTLWAGSIRGGLVRIKEVPVKIYTKVPLNIPYGLSNAAVISLCEEPDGRLWVGTDGGGINLYNPTTNLFKHFVDTYSENVVSMANCPTGKLMISLFGKGLFLFDKQTGATVPFIIENKKNNSEECTRGKSVYVDQCSDSKTLIIGNRLYVYDWNARNFSRVAVNGDYYAESLQKITTGLSEAYLFGIFHVLKVDCNTAQAEVVYDNHGKMVIQAAVFDGANTIWLGTHEGLFRLDLKTYQTERVETSLFSNVSLLNFDDHGRLWIGADNMLFCYTPEENRFVLLDESMGTYPIELFPMSLYKSYSETLYLGGNNGLVCIDKDINFKADALPYMNLVDVRINGLSRLYQVQDGGALKVPWNANSIEVQAGIQDEDVFSKNIFRFEILGATNTAIETYEHTLTLFSLLPGEYNIKISCCLENGDWSVPVEILTLNVVPPFWKSWWFFLLCVFVALLLVSLAVFLLIRKNKNELKWRIKEHEKEVDQGKIRFLINISHELRTPITLIYAPLKRILQSGSVTDRELEQELKCILKNANHMKELINMVLDLRELERGSGRLYLSTVSLNEWIHGIGDKFLGEFDAQNTKLVYEPDDQVSEVSIDPNKCEIVLSNMLMNSLKYGSPDSVVSIKTSILEEGRYVRISVSDCGVGLKGVDMEKLFSRFYRASYGNNGSGIGLAYAKQLIEMHNGRIGAYDNQGSSGATFYFDLPYLQPHSGEEEQQEISSSDAPVQIGMDKEMSVVTDGSAELKSLSVLVVEDNHEMNDFISSLLKEHFLHVYQAYNGVEALEQLEKHQPDGVISDVMMPVMDGFELCRTMKSDLKFSHIPMVLLTARSDAESNLIGYKVGAEAYISKPFESEMLLAVIQNILYNRSIMIRRYRESSLPAVKESTISNLDEQFLLKLNKVICQNIENSDLDVAFLTQEMAMSRASLYNKLKALTEMSVNDYVVKMRLEKASDLLQNSVLSVTEISENCGFSSQRYFSTVFKQVKGVTPTQYRKEHSEE